MLDSIRDITKLSRDQLLILIEVMEIVDRYGILDMSTKSGSSLIKRYNWGPLNHVLKNFFVPGEINSDFYEKAIGVRLIHLSENDANRFKKIYFNVGGPKTKNGEIRGPQTELFWGPQIYTPQIYTTQTKLNEYKKHFLQRTLEIKRGLYGKFKQELLRFMKTNDFEVVENFILKKLSKEDIAEMILDESYIVRVPEGYEVTTQTRILDVARGVLGHVGAGDKYTSLLIYFKNSNITDKVNTNTKIKKKRVQKPIDLNSKIAENEIHPMLKFCKTLKFLSKIKTQLTNDEAIKLMQKYDRKAIKEKLEHLNNVKDCQKKYNSVYLTVNNWCKTDLKKQTDEGQKLKRHKKIL